MFAPEESFYSTLIKVVDFEDLAEGPDAKVVQDLNKDSLFGHCTDSIWWTYDFEECKGKTINGVCNFAVEDLPRIRENQGGNCIMANKFRLDVDAAAVVCQMREMFNASGIML